MEIDLTKEKWNPGRGDGNEAFRFSNAFNTLLEAMNGMREPQKQCFIVHTRNAMDSIIEKHNIDLNKIVDDL